MKFAKILQNLIFPSNLDTLRNLYPGIFYSLEFVGMLFDLYVFQPQINIVLYLSNMTHPFTCIHLYDHIIQHVLLYCFLTSNILAMLNS